MKKQKLVYPEFSTFSREGYDTRSFGAVEAFYSQIINHLSMNIGPEISFGSPKPILGLFAYDHLRYETDRIATENDEPSLTEMTKFALEYFVKINQGFFFLIESGRIDHAYHGTRPKYALDEYVEFDNSIGVTKQFLKEKNLLDDTLLVVTADHSHVFTFGAYSSRGSNIFGFRSLEKSNISDVDGLTI
jgi:alkaline phosphatase